MRGSKQTDRRMRTILLWCIRAYQRYISPYKGFCCAYRAHTGRQSCSNLGFRAIRRYGVILGMAVLRRRTYLCGVAYRRHLQDSRRPHRFQRGDCDLGCDAPCDLHFDLPSAKPCSSMIDGVGCCDCGSCDWPERKRNDRDREQYVHIPPNSRINRHK